MPSTCTASNATGRPNASAARIASLCAASMPSMSNDWIGLGVTQLLRVGQHLGEFPPALAHLRQDVVAGAVQDAGDAGDAVAGQALAQRLDDGDAAGHRRLEPQRHVAPFRRRRQRRAVHRQHRLVGSDHGLAGRDAPPRPGRAPGPSAPPISSTTTSTPDRRRAPPGRRTSAGRTAARRGPCVRSRAETAVTAIGRPARAATRSALSRSSLSTPAPTVPEAGDGNGERPGHGSSPGEARRGWASWGILSRDGAAVQPTIAATAPVCSSDRRPGQSGECGRAGIGPFPSWPALSRPSAHGHRDHGSERGTTVGGRWPGLTPGHDGKDGAGHDGRSSFPARTATFTRLPPVVTGRWRTGGRGARRRPHGAVLMPRPCGRPRPARAAPRCSGSCMPMRRGAQQHRRRHGGKDGVEVPHRFGRNSGHAPARLGEGNGALPRCKGFCLRTRDRAFFRPRRQLLAGQGVGRHGQLRRQRMQPRRGDRRQPGLVGERRQHQPGAADEGEVVAVPVPLRRRVAAVRGVGGMEGCLALRGARAGAFAAVHAAASRYAWRARGRGSRNGSWRRSAGRRWDCRAGCRCGAGRCAGAPGSAPAQGAWGSAVACELGRPNPGPVRRFARGARGLAVPIGSARRIRVHRCASVVPLSYWARRRTRMGGTADGRFAVRGKGGCNHRCTRMHTDGAGGGRGGGAAGRGVTVHGVLVAVCHAGGVCGGGCGTRREKRRGLFAVRTVLPVGARIDGGEGAAGLPADARGRRPRDGPASGA